MPASDQVAVPAQHGLRPDQQPQTVEQLAGLSVQQRGEEGPIRRRELDLLPVQLPLQDGDLVPERGISASLSRSLIGSNRSSANALVTPR